MTDEPLVQALAAIAARGAIGESSLQRAIEHAQQYVDKVPAQAGTLCDLGSGGGLPGLVIAVRCPGLRITLVERRATRADLLRRAVRSLALDDRVEVIADDVQQVAQRAAGSFDVVTARSFAAPPITAKWAGRLLRPGGVLIVSEPPEDDPARWTDAVLDAAGLVDQGRDQGVRTFLRR
ncbi:MAG: putative ribosomal small subunit methyltransferase [Actinomycetota bacterium]|jgi:16S rRNA (guanine527-N7)-methyltransferase